MEDFQLFFWQTLADIDPGIALVAFCLVIFGSMVQASLGMGFGLAAAPLLAIVDASLVPSVPLLLATITAAIAAARSHRSIVPAEFCTATLGRTVGAVLAAYFLAKMIDADTFSIIFAIGILCALLLQIFLIPIAFSKGTLFTMGTLSGIMGTITSVGAPPMALLYRNRPPLDSRATLSAFFAVGGAVSALSLWAAGWFSARELLLSFLLLPGVFLGSWWADRLQHHIDRRFSKLLVLLVCVASLVLILRPLLG